MRGRQHLPRRENRAHPPGRAPVPRRRNADASSSSRPSAAAAPTARWPRPASAPTCGSPARLGDRCAGRQDWKRRCGRRGVKSFVRRDPQVQTGSSVALSFTNGCRHFISRQPNNDTFCFDDIDLARVGRRRAPAAGRRLVLRTAAGGRQCHSSCRPHATAGWPRRWT